jgi:translocation and assembly module TamA
LRRTSTFGSVALIEAETIGPDQSLDITAEIAEQKRRRFGFGGEVATSDGISLRTYWVNRNLWGGAERLRFDAEITGIGGTQNNEEYLLSARYDRPATWGPDTDLFVVGRLEQEDKDDLFSRRATVGVGFKHFPSDQRTYEYGIGLSAGEDRDALGDKKYLLFILPAKLTRDYRDIPLDPTKGHFLIASVIPFLAIDGADNGLRTFIDYRIYRSIGEVRPVTFAFRAQLGSVAGPSLADSPSDFLFYSGGSGTVRGHPYESLGVDLGGGSQIGGRSFLGFSAEARVKVTDTIGVVGFFDYGFVGSDPLPSDSTGDYQTGAGLGVRYATGIGPIRLDVAVPVSGPDTGSNFEIYVGIGQAF